MKMTVKRGESPFGPALTRRLKDSGMKQAELCRLTGISSSYMSQLLGGRILKPQARHIYLISKALGITVEDVMKDIEDLEQ